MYQLMITKFGLDLEVKPLSTCKDMIIRQEKSFSQIGRYITKKYGEVNIQENVRWDKYSGIILKFVHLDYNHVATSKLFPGMS